MASHAGDGSQEPKTKHFIGDARDIAKRNFLIICTIAVCGTGFCTITVIQLDGEQLSAFFRVVGTQES